MKEVEAVEEIQIRIKFSKTPKVTRVEHISPSPKSYLQTLFKTPGGINAHLKACRKLIKVQF